MWILKNSTSLLSSLDELDVCTATSVQTFDFLTLCTSIAHDLLKSIISNLVGNAFRKKDGSVRYTHIKVTRAKGYFTHDINGSEDGMHAVLFLYSYENEFLDNMTRSGHMRLARSFNLCYRYIDHLIVFNNKKFLDYLKEIYPSQLTVEKANKSDHLADYLDLTFIIDSGGKLSTRLYDKHDFLTSTLSIFHSFPATYHLALLVVRIFHSLLDMHDAVHTMMISDITTSA